MSAKRSRTSSSVPSAPAATIGGFRPWSLVLWGAVIGLIVHLCSTAVTIRMSDGQMALPLGLMQVGTVILRATVVYGAWQQAKWSAWAGGFLYGANLLLAPLGIIGSLALPGGQLTASDTASAVLLGLGQVIASILFLVGLVLHRRKARRRS